MSDITVSERSVGSCVVRRRSCQLRPRRGEAGSFARGVAKLAASPTKALHSGREFLVATPWRCSYDKTPFMFRRVYSSHLETTRTGRHLHCDGSVPHGKRQRRIMSSNADG